MAAAPPAPDEAVSPAPRVPPRRALPLGPPPTVMGILNITPDSFSDAGRWLEPERAVAHGLRLLEQGADVLDLGAESTRPGGGVYGEGASEVGVEEELDRLLPVLEALRAETEAPLSVDTRKAAVAEAALAAGADAINDVSALGDPRMAEVVAAARCPVVLMHSRGSIREMQHHARYDDAVEEVRQELEAAAGRALAAGIAAERVVLDPGIGFAKGAAHNLALLRRLDRLVELGYPVLVGASRKSFIGRLTGQPPAERLEGSLAAIGWAAIHGAAMVRVHDVAATVRFLQVWRAVAQADPR